MSQVREVSIIGSGPAGLTAAIYAARAGLDPVVIAGYVPGGQLMNTTLVENYPGFPDGVDGPLLMQNMMKQAERFGAQLVLSDASQVDLGGDVKVITTTDGKEFKARSVIIATGATPRRLDIPGEDDFYGRGVSTCATCDGALFRDMEIAVVGGGDSAMEEASFLTRFASKVYLIHRRDEFRASKIMADRVLKNPKIEIIWNTEVKKVVGDDTGVTHLVIQDNKNDEESQLKVTGLFLAIGHIPVTGFLNGVSLDPQGYVVSVDGTRTNIDGVFVAGDVEDDVYRQAITAAGLGARAAITAEKWLADKD